MTTISFFEFWKYENVKKVLRNSITALKMSKYGIFSRPYFPAFGLNTKRYGLSLRIQSECGKVLTRKNSYLDTFQALHMTPTFRLTPLEKPDFFILVDRFYERLETNGKYSQTYGNSSFFRY